MTHRTDTRPRTPNPSQAAVIQAVPPGQWFTIEDIALRMARDGHPVRPDPHVGWVLDTPMGEPRKIASLLRKMKSLGWARNRHDGDDVLWTVTPSSIGH